jgi:signal transduction histidine kinase
VMRLKLINDILDLAKVDAGKMVFWKQHLKVKSSISSMLHLFENKIQEKNLKLIKEYDPSIPDDSRRSDLFASDCFKFS